MGVGMTWRNQEPNKCPFGRHGSGHGTQSGALDGHICAGSESKSKSKEVREFAQLMVTDHSGVNKSASELVQKLHVTPESNAISQSLQKGGDDNLSALKKLSGRAFDNAYVDHEIAYHQAVLDAVDTTLIPSAQNAELKALLIKVRPAFVAHLDHAKHLKADLAK